VPGGHRVRRKSGLGSPHLRVETKGAGVWGADGAVQDGIDSMNIKPKDRHSL
jgi:hypothetical protein